MPKVNFWLNTILRISEEKALKNVAKKNPPSSPGGRKYVARNRKASHDYTIIEKIEAGLQLRGTEVKSIRMGHAGLSGSYAHIDKRTNEAFINNMTIPPYDFGNRFNHDSLRTRKLLLHKREIRRLREFVEQKGNTLIPLSLYFIKGRVKVELGVCKGKAYADKREAIRRRDAERDTQREVARHFRG